MHETTRTLALSLPVTRKDPLQSTRKTGNLQRKRKPDFFASTKLETTSCTRYTISYDLWRLIGFFWSRQHTSNKTPRHGGRTHKIGPGKAKTRTNPSIAATRLKLASAEKHAATPQTNVNEQSASSEQNEVCESLTPVHRGTVWWKLEARENEEETRAKRWRTNAKCGGKCGKTSDSTSSVEIMWFEKLCYFLFWLIFNTFYVQNPCYPYFLNFLHYFLQLLLWYFNDKIEKLKKG